MSTKGRLIRLLSKWVLNEGVVTEVAAVSPDFVRLLVKAEAGKDAGWQPGDKVQVLLPDDEVRTLTPLYWNADGSTALLVYRHGDHPLSRWTRQVEAGERIRFAGPARSLVMPAGSLTLVGDETSIAVAASYARARPGQVRVWIEVDAGRSLAEVLLAVGLADARTVEREPGMPRGQALASALDQVSGAIGITGGAELVQRVRARVRELSRAELKTRTYWAEGRAGLD